MTHLTRADLDLMRSKGRISAAEHRRLVNEDKNVGMMFPKSVTVPKARRTPSLGKMRVRKGKAGELQLAHMIEAATGQQARRVPMSGAMKEVSGSDLFGEAFNANGVLAGFSVECKNVEKPKLEKWWEKAKLDAAGKTPALCIKRPGGEWIVVLPMQTWLDMAREIWESGGGDRNRCP